MYRKLVTIAAFAVALPASSQTLLDQLLAKAMKPKAVAAQPGRPSSFAAAITPEQQSTLDRLLAQPLPDKRIAADRQEAEQIIRAVVVTGACATASDAWNSLNRYSMTPQTFHEPFYGELVPMENLKYHDKSRCLDVLRFADWSKPANNALTFRVYYVAADSGEAKRQTFELQKGSDGQWLVRQIGVGLN